MISSAVVSLPVEPVFTHDQALSKHHRQTQGLLRSLGLRIKLGFRAVLDVILRLAILSIYLSNLLLSRLLPST